MSSLPTLQATPARFRKKEFDRLFSGLKEIICHRSGYVVSGHTKNENYWRVLPHRYPAGACFDQELMDRIAELWSLLYPLAQDKKCQSRRLNLDELQIRTLALGLRMARHQASHRAPGQPVPVRLRAFPRLLRKLGLLQRRAGRAWARAESAQFCAQYHARWKKFELWIRTEFGCLCQQPPIIQTRRRLYVTRGIEVAEEALREAEVLAPDEAQLRRFVRLAYREIRRGRQPFSIADILRGQEPARFFLSYFIRERLRRNGELKSVSSI